MTVIADLVFRTFTCSAVVPLADMVVKDLENGRSNPSASALLVTIWELGEAAGPLLIAPLSEIFGRYPIMNGCTTLFVLATVLAATSHSTHALMAFRALTGLAVASNVLNPAIIGDIFESDQRGSAMSLVMLAPLIGGAVGPASGGAIAQTYGWRLVLYISTALAATCEILFLTCFRETYSISILRRRARSSQSDTNGWGSKAKSDHKDIKKLWHSITRPFAVLFSSNVLILLSLFGSVCFSFFYVIIVTLTDILQDVYGFSTAFVGIAFITTSESINLSCVGVSILTNN